MRASAARSRCRGRSEPGAARSRPADIIREAGALRRSLEAGFREEVVTSLYGEVERVARRAVRDEGSRPLELDQSIDRIVTSRLLGLPLMMLILAVIFWLTIIGANVPSAMLASGVVRDRRCRRGVVHQLGRRRGGSPASSGTACSAAWRG